MKINKIAALLIILFGISSSLYSMDEQSKTSFDEIITQPKTDTLVYTVYGMDCPGCAGGLEKQVNKIPAVKDSEADWIKQELRVIMKPDSVLDISELKKRVEKANFTLVTKSKAEKDED